MSDFETLKNFLQTNKAYILTILVFYLLTGHILLKMPFNWLIASSFTFTLTTTLTYTGFDYLGKEGLRYWILSFIMNLGLILLLLIFTYQGPPNTPRTTESQACKQTIQIQCQASGANNISIPETCIQDGSIMKDAISNEVIQSSELEEAKVVCS